MSNRKNKNPQIHSNLPKIHAILPFLIIAIAAVLVYSNSFLCEFQYDDITNIADRPIIRNLKNFTNPNLWTNVNFRPLAMFSFAINYQLGQLDVTGYHIFNLIIHIICGFLVFLLIKKILSIYLSLKNNDSTVTWFSLFIALIFTLHPLQTQSVTYIVQRMTSMSGLFYLLASYLFLIGRTQHSQKGFSHSVFIVYFLVILSAILSLMAKQIAVTLPLSLLLIEICFIRSKEGKIYKKFILTSLSILILALLVVVLSGNLPRETKQISRLNYLFTQFKVITRYIQLSILPINQNLDHDIRASTSFWNFGEITGFLLICFLIFFSIISFKKDKLITFGIGWFFITLALESSIIPIGSTIYEHRLYLALMGYSVCLVTIIYKLTQKRNKMMLYILVLIVISYGILTFQRNKVWKNRFTLWSDVLKKSPQKARGYFNMGNILSEAGHQKMSINYYSKAIKLKPDFVKALVNLGNAWKRMDNFDKAIQYYNKALEYDAEYTKALNNIGLILTDKGEYQEATEYYNRALQLNKNNAEIINNLGIVLAQQGKYDKAIEYFKRALQLKPDYENAKKNLEITKNFLESSR